MIQSYSGRSDQHEIQGGAQSQVEMKAAYDAEKTTAGTHKILKMIFNFNIQSRFWRASSQVFRSTTAEQVPGTGDLISQHQHVTVVIADDRAILICVARVRAKRMLESLTSVNRASRLSQFARRPQVQVPI